MCVIDQVWRQLRQDIGQVYYIARKKRLTLEGLTRAHEKSILLTWVANQNKSTVAHSRIRPCNIYYWAFSRAIEQ